MIILKTTLNLSSNTLGCNNSTNQEHLLANANNNIIPVAMATRRVLALCCLCWWQVLYSRSQGQRHARRWCGGAKVDPKRPTIMSSVFTINEFWFAMDAFYNCYSYFDSTILGSGFTATTGKAVKKREEIYLSNRFM